MKRLRLKEKMTLERAAELAEMDLTHWQKLEAGRLNPTLVTIMRVADGLDVEVAELFRPGR